MYEQCGEKLQSLSGRSLDLVKVRNAIGLDRSDEFAMYVLSIMYVESRFLTTAVSHRNAYGLMQITSPAIQDAAEYCALPRNPRNLFGVTTNVQYGSCYLSKIWEQQGRDWTRSLIIYNGGYRGLTQYETGTNINLETANYVLQVRRMVSFCTQQQG